MATANAVREQINFSLSARPSLAKRIETAAERLNMPASAVCRDVVDTFLDAYVEWTERAEEQRRQAMAAMGQAARTQAPPARFTGDERR